MAGDECVDMVRRAFHIRIADGEREEYIDAHENVPEALEAAYLDDDVGLRWYSIFEADGHVFGALEADDPDALDASLGESEAMAEWNDRMDDVIEEVTDLDEVYRLR